MGKDLQGTRGEKGPAGKSPAGLFSRLWAEHTVSLDAKVAKATMTPGTIVPTGLAVAAILAIMSFVPVVQRFTGFDEPGVAFAVLLLAQLASYGMWLAIDRVHLRSILTILDASGYVTIVVLVSAHTTSPTRYVFAVLYGQAVAYYGTEYARSIPMVVGLTVVPISIAVWLCWPDAGVLAIMLFGGLMFWLNSVATGRRRELLLEKERLQQAFRTADDVASHSLDIAIATTVAEVGGLLHQLANSLSPVVTNLDAIDVARLEADDREAVADASASLKRSTTLLRRLLENMKERGSIEASTYVLDGVLRSALADAVAGLKADWELKGGEGLQLKGNPEHLQLLVTNLVTNSVHAGARRVSVHVDKVDDVQVRLKVIDDGPGVPPERLERLFAAPTAEGRQVGHGFGLYLSRRLAELLGGNLVLASTGPTGTTFEVSLRLPPVLDPSIAQRQAANA